MAFVHTKDTFISVDGNNLSTFTNESDFGKEADVHDVTTYGKDAKVKRGGLLDSSGKAGGLYDSSTTAGPRAVLLPLVGETVTVIRRPEGTGSGLPQDTFSAVLKKYNESSPVADMVKWSIELEGSDDVDSTAQA
jgi:hypothetical protein